MRPGTGTFRLATSDESVATTRTCRGRGRSDAVEQPQHDEHDDDEPQERPERAEEPPEHVEERVEHFERALAETAPSVTEREEPPTPPRE